METLALLSQHLRSGSTQNHKGFVRFPYYWGKKVSKDTKKRGRGARRFLALMLLVCSKVEMVGLGGLVLLKEYQKVEKRSVPHITRKGLRKERCD